MREYDDKDKFFIDDLKGVMALEGLGEVRTPPDPLRYCAGISSAHSSFYDVTDPLIESREQSATMEICISGYPRHWYTGVADHVDVVNDDGASVGRTTGVEAIRQDCDFVVRFYLT